MAATELPDAGYPDTQRFLIDVERRALTSIRTDAKRALTQLNYSIARHSAAFSPQLSTPSSHQLSTPNTDAKVE